jgi:solute carrier family 13 (sodium-dependent dicarboxylate transporter), member 2/3/5
VVGIAVCVLMLILPPPAGMPLAAWRTAAAAALMAAWWVTEAIPIAATALIPLVLFPILGIATIGAASSPYANPVIYLFLGGFMLAAAMQRVGLHRRLALAVLSTFGARPDRLVLGFLVASAAISMWVSNTATVLMVLPLATPVLELLRHHEERAGTLEVTLLLGVAYGASLGGLGTLIGTPPNALFAGFMLETHGMRIGFARWMMIGVPLVVISVWLTWIVLTRFAFKVSRVPAPGVAEAVRAQRHALGSATRGEMRVGTVMLLTAIAWVTQPLIARAIPGVSDTVIAIAATLVLFVMPGEGGQPALDWKSAESLPWGVLVLFGGGLSLADAIQSSGLATWLGASLEGLRVLPLFVIVLLVTTLVTFLTELTSNTATAAAFLPLASSLAIAIGTDPVMLAVATTLAASSGFMLPVGTPPNAIVFGSGRLTIPQMARAGLPIDVILILLITVVSYWLAVPALRN